jgi:CubicO group peptidase (beta-lactamase class C family)
MAEVVSRVTELAVESGFSGVIRVDRSGQGPWSAAFGLPDRRHGIANEVDTQFAIASGVKGFIALLVVSLIEEGALSLGTAARDVLSADLPLISDQVSIEHLLAHRSGIGDYVDEEAVDITDYVLDVPVHQLDRTAAYLPILACRPVKSLPVSASPTATAGTRVGADGGTSIGPALPVVGRGTGVYAGWHA